MIDDLKEFAGETQSEAVAKAARHFGIDASRLEVIPASERLEISGLAGRVLVVARVTEEAEEPEEPEETGPVGEFVHKLLELMGAGEGVRLSESQSEGHIVVALRGAQLRQMTRRDNRLGGALTHLASRAAQRLVSPEAAARVEILTGDSSEERLERDALARAEEVKRRRRPVEMDGLDSRQRWIVHNALRAVDGIRTESVGEGRVKRVKIFPA